MGYLAPFNLKRYRKKGTDLSTVCPWAVMADEGIVLGKNGAVTRSYEFVAPDLGSSSQDKIASIANSFNNSLKQLGEGWAIQFEVHRNYSNDYPGSPMDNIAAYLVEQQRERNFSQLQAHFESNYYLSFTYQLPPDIKSKSRNFFFKQSEIYDGLNMGIMKRHLREFRMATDKCIAPVRARMSVKPLNSVELVTYLHKSVSLFWHDLVLPQEYQIFLDRILTDQDLETTQPLRLGEYYIPILCIHSFPGDTDPAMLDSLNAAMVPYRWSTRFINYDKQTAKKIIEKAQKRFYGARKSLGQYAAETLMGVESGRENAGAMIQESDTNAAMQEAAMGTFGYGEYTSNIMVWDTDYEAAMNKAKYLAGVIGGVGFTVREETHNAMQAFESMMPGNVYANVHRLCISTGNVSHVIPISSIWSGIKDNKFFDVISGNNRPHVICSTNYGIPFFLNLNVGGVGHTWISGPTGGGKSTLLGLLEIQWLKYKNAQVIILDKDRSARSVTTAVGGVYIEPGKGNIAFQPLAEIDTPEQRTWACQFIECLLEEQHIEITPGMRKSINEAVGLLAGKPVQSRTLTSFLQYCLYQNPVTKVNDVTEGVSPYTLSGLYGRLFDSDTTRLPDSSWMMYEMGTLMNMPQGAVAPALMFIFKEIEKRFAPGKPSLLVMDEAWIFLKNPIMARKITDWLKTLRKKHVFVVFATQEINDAVSSPVAKTIISQCPSKIYLADSSARTPASREAYAQFGLEESEIELLADSTAQQDYFYKSVLGCRLFQLDLDRLQLDIIASDHAVLDRVEKKYGRNTGKPLVYEILKEKGYKL
jgi:type IV secretion system protein VirB4